MEAICLEAKMVASNDRPFYASVTEEMIKEEKKKVIAWLTETLSLELYFRILKKTTARFFDLSFLCSIHIVPTDNKWKQAGPNVLCFL